MDVYSVGQIHRHLKEILSQDSLLNQVWIHGEIGNLARPGSGHTYFNLRESNSILRSVMFRGALGTDLLEEGLEVVVHGRIAIYEPRGDLQFIADIVQLEGVGELQLRLEELKLKLKSEGLFDPSRKRSIPTFPGRVGVVTSPTGAVWHDIKTVVERRYPIAELVLAPCAVQGDGAFETVVEAIDVLNRLGDLDVIILARGGGSLEDLWAFNEELVARAIFQSNIPVISAIGHETDVTISDMVADKRAPTPTAAAEIVVPDRTELVSDISAAVHLNSASIFRRLNENKRTVAIFPLRLNSSSPDLDHYRLRVDDLLRVVGGALKNDIALKVEGIKGYEGRLSSLNPKDTLRRGYAIVQAGDSLAVVNDPSLVTMGERVKITVAKGRFEADVVKSGENLGN